MFFWLLQEWTSLQIHPKVQLSSAGKNNVKIPRAACQTLQASVSMKCGLFGSLCSVKRTWQHALQVCKTASELWDFWIKVLWTDTAAGEMFGPNAQHHVWSKHNKACPRGGGEVMIWTWAPCSYWVDCELSLSVTGSHWSETDTPSCAFAITYTGCACTCAQESPRENRVLTRCVEL